MFQTLDSNDQLILNSDSNHAMFRDFRLKLTSLAIKAELYKQ